MYWCVIISSTTNPVEKIKKEKFNETFIKSAQ